MCWHDALVDNIELAGSNGMQTGCQSCKLSMHLLSRTGLHHYSTADGAKTVPQLSSAFALLHHSSTLTQLCFSPVSHAHLLAVVFPQREVEQLQEEADSRSAAVARAAADAAEVEVAHLKRQLAEAHAALDGKGQELASAKALLDSADKTQHEEMLRLQVRAAWRVPCNAL